MEAMTYGSMIEALGPPTRRAIFEKLCEGPSSVQRLASAFPVSRPAVSQHLRVLKDAGLVWEARRGVERIYSVNPKGVEALRDYFARFWDRATNAFTRSPETASG